MKKNIHPIMYPTIFIDAATGDKIITASTLVTQEKMTIDGVEYQVVHSDITSHSHPFFTGEVRFVDAQGAVDRFLQKIKRADAKKLALAQKEQAKKKVEVPAGDPKTYRDLLREKQDTLRKSKVTQQ